MTTARTYGNGAAQNSAISGTSGVRGRDSAERHAGLHIYCLVCVVWDDRGADWCDVYCWDYSPRPAVASLTGSRFRDGDLLAASPALTQRSQSRGFVLIKTADFPDRY